MGILDLFKPNVEKMEAKKDVRGLRDVLRRKGGDFRRRSAEALGRIGGPAVSPLIQILQGEDENVREIVMETLGNIGEAAVSPLIQALMEEGSQPQAALALKRVGEPAVGPLVQALEDQSNHPMIRSGAALGLGEMGDNRALEPLVQALKDKHSVIREKAAHALYLMEWKPEDEPMKFDYLIAKKDWEELQDLGESAVEPLIRALKDEDSEIRGKSASILGWIGDIRAVEPLLQTLKDDEKEVRESAVLALGWLGDKKVTGPLLEMLQDKYPFIRFAAAKALAKIGEPLAIQTAIEKLILLFNFENDNVAAMIVMTLTEIGEPGIESLLQVFEDESSSPRMKMGASLTLGEIGDERAIEPLIQAAKDDDENVRDCALTSLKKLNKFEEAEERYSETVRMNPDIAQAHYNLGNVLYHSEKVGEAEKEYREAIRLDPDHANAHKMLGNLLEQLNDLSGAEKEYRKAIQNDPENAKFHCDLGGFLFTKLAKCSEAEDEFRQAITLDPNFAKPHALLGCWLGAVYKTEEARQELNTAIRLYSEVGNTEMVSKYSKIIEKI